MLADTQIVLFIIFIGAGRFHIQWEVFCEKDADIYRIIV